MPTPTPHALLADQMGAALQVDWNEVKTLALAIGVREAARRMELPEDAVRQRSSREGWLVKQREFDAKVEVIKSTIRQEQGMSPEAVTASSVLASMGVNTRTKLASVAQRAAEKLDTLDEDELLSPAVTDVAFKYTSMAAKVHGWDQKAQSERNGVVINIALAGLSPEMAVAEPVIAPEAPEQP